MRYLGVIIMFCFTVHFASSQNVLTLEQCKELALKNNIQAKKSELSVEISRQQKKEAFTKYFPSISATGLGFATNKPMMSMDMSSMMEGLTPIMMALVEQGLLDPAAISTEPQKIDMLKKGTIGAVMVAQPVFAGGQIIHGNQLAKLGAEVAELQKTMSNDELLLTVEQYYWQIVALEEKSKTIAEAETLLNRVHTDVKNALDAGLINRNDLLKVELKQNELESGKLKLANGLRLSKMVLAQFIGMPEENFDIDKSLIENINLLFDTHIDHQTALHQRAEYQLLDKNIEVNKLQVKMETGKHLPTVAVGAGWNYMNFDKGSPYAMDNNFGMLFATVSVPISDWWGGSHAIRKQKMQVMIAENDKRNSGELLLIQMQQLQNDVEEAAQQVQLADKAIVSALENLRLNTDYYEAGTGLLTDLLDAQNALQQVRDQRTEAITIYCIKLAKYKQATGW